MIATSKSSSCMSSDFGEIFSSVYFWDASFNRHFLSSHYKGDSGLSSRQPHDESETVPRLQELPVHHGREMRGNDDNIGGKCCSRGLLKAPLEHEGKSHYLCLASWEKLHNSWA